MTIPLPFQTAKAIMDAIADMKERPSEAVWADLQSGARLALSTWAQATTSLTPAPKPRRKAGVEAGAPEAKDGMLVVSAGHLREMIRDLSQAAGVKCNIPILAHARVAQDGDGIAVTATDMEQLLTLRSTRARMQKAPPFLLPLEPLGKAIRKMPADATVTIQPDGENLTVTLGGEAKIAMLTLPVKDFPAAEDGLTLPGAPMLPHKIMAVEAARFHAALARTMPCVSTEETRYYLNGVSMECRADGAVRMVSTDGHRLMMDVIPVECAAAAWPQSEHDKAPARLILPRGSMRTMMRVLPMAGTISVRVGADNLRMSFSAGDATFVTKLIDGTFPDVDRVIPRQDTMVAFVEADARAFEAALNAVAISDMKSIRVSIEMGDGIVKLNTHCAERGVASTTLPTIKATGTMTIGFQVRYLLDFLKHGDVIGLAFADASSPAIITLSSRDNADEVMGVLMPMRA